MSRPLAMALFVALVWFVAAPARAERRVLVRLASDDPLSAAIALELRWRGTDALVAPPDEDEGEDRAYRSLVMAQMHGADAAVWIDDARDGAPAAVHAVRTEDGLEASSPIPPRSPRTELRETALLAALLVDELFALTALTQCAPTNASPTVAAVRDRARELAPPPGGGELRLYYLLGTGALAAFDRWWPGFTGHMSLGAEWPGGFRVGATAAVMLIITEYRDDWGYAASFEGPLPVGGVEIAQRWDERRYVLWLGAHLMGGVAMRHANISDTKYPALLVPGASAGVGFPVGNSGEIGLRGDVDLWLEDQRGPAPTVRLSIEWGWH